MFGLFTKNLDAMGKSTKKSKSLSEIDDLTRIEKQDLQKILGGNQNMIDKKKSKNLFGLSFLSPCEGDLPQ